MYEFEILSQEMKVIVKGLVERFLKEQFFVEWITPSAKAVDGAAFLKYRATNWRDNTHMVLSIWYHYGKQSEYSNYRKEREKEFRCNLQSYPMDQYW